MSAKDPKLLKHELRSKMSNALRNLSRESKLTASELISSKLKQWLISHPEVSVIATFAHLSIEPDVSSLIKSMPQLEWAYPHSKEGGVMELHRVTDLSELDSGLYGILQPKSDPTTLTPPQKIDCYLCPAYAYTSDGSRLGKGGGYYDRLLAKRKSDSTLIGIAFKEQLLDQLPTEEHDIKVDFTITD